MNDHNLRPSFVPLLGTLRPHISVYVIAHPIHVNCAPKETEYTGLEIDRWWVDQDKDEEWIARNSE